MNTDSSSGRTADEHSGNTTRSDTDVTLSTEKRSKAPILVFIVLTLVAAAFSVNNVVLYIVWQAAPDPDTSGVNAWYRLFDVGQEANLPTWYAGVLWLFAALMAFCYSLVIEHPLAWRLLAVVCVVLSADEMAVLHEQLHYVGVGTGADRFGSAVAYPWLIPGLIISLLIGLAFLRTILRLPLTQRLLVLLSGALFLTGLLVIENIGGMVLRGEMHVTQTYVVITATEEFFEMMSVALFACTMMSLMTLTRVDKAVQLEHR